MNKNILILERKGKEVYTQSNENFCKAKTLKGYTVWREDPERNRSIRGVMPLVLSYNTPENWKAVKPTVVQNYNRSLRSVDEKFVTACDFLFYVFLIIE
jgi:hypothetical protein